MNRLETTLGGGLFASHPFKVLWFSWALNEETAADASELLADAVPSQIFRCL